MLNFDKNFNQFKDFKLNNFEVNIDKCIVEINNPFILSEIEKNKIKQLCKINNFALIKTKHFDDYAEPVFSLNQQLGLIENDKHLFSNNKPLANITTADVITNATTNKKQGEFIPYTNKKINWHTDGYYNDYAHRVRSFTLFCSNPAVVGGENQWLDIEMLYILLREKDEKLTKLLTNENAMTIPAHIENGKILRPESSGAIFIFDNKTNSLYMRYTQRKKNIVFNDEVVEAVKLLDAVLATKSPYHFCYKMQSGEGIINNNVIHTRGGFEDDKNHPRLMLRGRYFVRV